MKMKTELKWGIMGPGLIAWKLADALNHVEGCKLLGIASNTPGKAEHFAENHNNVKIYTYEELAESEEIDIIYVATTHNFHYENIKLALENGKHVLVEKPFTVNAAQARELVNIARKNKLFLMEAIWVRFLPSYVKLKSLLKSGVIGNIELLDLSFGVYVGKDHVERLTRPELAGGVTLDIGIYPISFVCYMLDEIPEEIHSTTNMSETGVDKTSSYLFKFKSGIQASIKCSYYLKMKNEAVIYGDKGYIEYPNFQHGEKFTISIHDGSNSIKEVNEIYQENFKNGFIYQVEEVAKCINEGKIESPVICHDETIAIMEIMDKLRAQWNFTYPFE